MGGCIRKQVKENRQRFTNIRQKEQQNQKQQESQNLHPINVYNGINIRKNPITNKLEGFPQQWAKYNLAYDIDQNKIDENAKDLPNEIKPQQLPDNIKKFIQSKTILLSQILETEQNKSRLHSIKTKLQVDKTNPYGIKNLPQVWIQSIKSSQLNPQDLWSDPQSMIDIITLYSPVITESKLRKTLLSESDFQQIVSKVRIIQQNPALQYVFTNQLGKGGVCQVYRAYLRSNPSEVFAVRIIKIKQFQKQALLKIKEQIAVMLVCCSENIIKYYESHYYNETLFMFIEYMDAGSLTSFINKYKCRIPQDVIGYIMKEILIGLSAIHKKHQIHRDIKSDNILLNLKGDIKIGDFGYALQLTKQCLATKGVVGTPAWMAPQLIKKQQYNQSIDIWSLGIVALQLAIGQPPYLKFNPLRAMYMILSQPQPTVKGFSISFSSFLEGCLQKNPQRRLNVKQLLNHQFISKRGQIQKNKFIDMLNKSITKQTKNNTNSKEEKN